MGNQTKNQVGNLVYFISYSHSRGKGNVEIFLTGEISHIDTVYSISRNIEEEFMFNEVTIDNWIFLREVEFDDEEEN